MKKILFAICLGSFFLASCNEKKLEQQQSQIDSLLAVNNMTAEELNDYVLLVNSLSSSIDDITAAEGSLSAAAKEGSPQEQRQLLKEKVANLADVVSKQRKNIEELEKRLASSGKDNSKLRSFIEMMKKQLDEKDQMIAQLQSEIENKNASIAQLTEGVKTLQTKNTELSTTVSSQQETITAQTNTMNEAFVKIATKSELKEAGILTGGFLKKKTVNVNNIDKRLFQKVDMRTYKEVTVASKNPQILSQMPADSYRMTKNGNVTTITILDAAKFWSITNILIVSL